MKNIYHDFENAFVIDKTIEMLFIFFYTNLMIVCFFLINWKKFFNEFSNYELLKKFIVFDFFLFKCRICIQFVKFAKNDLSFLKYFSILNDEFHRAFNDSKNIIKRVQIFTYVLSQNSKNDSKIIDSWRVHTRIFFSKIESFFNVKDYLKQYVKKKNSMKFLFFSRKTLLYWKVNSKFILNVKKFNR